MNVRVEDLDSPMTLSGIRVDDGASTPDNPNRMTLVSGIDALKVYFVYTVP